MASVTLPGAEALKLLLDGLRGAGNVLREADKIPQYQAVLDAQTQIAEMQIQLYDLDGKLREVSQELKRVQEDQASAEGKKIWQDLLWIANDDDPYCVHCWESRKRLFHVFKIDSQGNGMRTRCPECGSSTWYHPGQSYWQWEKAAEATSAIVPNMNFQSSESASGKE